MCPKSPNDQDQCNNGKSSKSNSVHTKKHEKGKDHTTNSSHKCRCSSGSQSSTSRSTASVQTTSTALLRNLKDLPVREYVKLSPTPPNSMTKKCSSASDPTPLNDKIRSPKASNHNGSSKSSENASEIKKDTVDNAKPDDALILRIGSLEKSSRRLSSLSINRNSGDKTVVKIKVRTKTDPHPISSSQKLRDFSSANTLSTVFSSTHTANKCNCSSCKSMSSSVSNSDNHNKTKSVGTQHDATSNAYDPWVRQNSLQTDVELSSKNLSSKSVLTQKIANSNAKVIVITDDFKKKALNQDVFVDTKRKMMRYMKANKLTNSSRSMDDENEPDEPAKIEKQKAISKSVDNVSLDNVGSVELIFISDEFLNKVAKPDVIILVCIPFGNRQLCG